MGEKKKTGIIQSMPMQQSISGDNFCESEVQAQADPFFQKAPLHPCAGHQVLLLQPLALPALQRRYSVRKTCPQAHLLHQNMAPRQG